MDTISGFWAGAIRVAGRVDLDAVSAALGGWTSLVRASVDDLVTAGVPFAVAREWLTAAPLHTRGRALVRTLPEYPPALRTIPRAPPVVFVEGDPACLHAPAIAIVGTRACSPYGASAAHRIAHGAAAAGLVVVSGLARGIDASAHKGALAAKGRTVAVLGHGLGHTAPPANRPLRDADRGGARADAHHLARRRAARPLHLSGAQPVDRGPGPSGRRRRGAGQERRADHGRAAARARPGARSVRRPGPARSRELAGIDGPAVLRRPSAGRR